MPCENNPVKDVFAISIPQSEEDKNGRMSWDQTAVLIAVKGYENYFDIKKELHKGVLKVINDQFNYDCHCLAKGIPMSLPSLKEKKKEFFDKLSKQEKVKIKSALLSIRECLLDNAFWVLPLNNPELMSPPTQFNYSEKFTDKVREFFSTRGHPIPS